MDSKIAHVADIVTSRFGQMMDLDPAGLDLEARLDDVYKVSSFNRMWLLNELERELGIALPEDEGRRAWTLADLIDLCERCAAAQVGE
jgi:acyl carrier protein